jgi:hypothetical protein
MSMYQRQLKAAMAEMDKDGDGTVSYEEFESWWRNNGGDLEKHRALAFTVVLPDINLLLVRTSSTRLSSATLCLFVSASLPVYLSVSVPHIHVLACGHAAVCCYHPRHLKCVVRVAPGGRECSSQTALVAWPPGGAEEAWEGGVVHVHTVYLRTSLTSVLSFCRTAFLSAAR